MGRNENDNRWDKVKEIWGVIERLRGEGGCPWDRKQTPLTVQTYLVEEAHEGAAAIRAGKVKEVAEEMGDVLFMVLFLIYLYEQKGDFSLEEVCGRIVEKMVRRHPHVFGETSVESADEVKDNWEKIKAEEKKESGKAGEPVPDTLPALMRAYRIASRAPRRGEEANRDDLRTWLKDFSQRSAKMAEELGTGRFDCVETIGPLFFALVNIARLKGWRSEDCLHQALARIEYESA